MESIVKFRRSLSIETHSLIYWLTVPSAKLGYDRSINQGTLVMEFGFPTK